MAFLSCICCVLLFLFVLTSFLCAMVTELSSVVRLPTVAEAEADGEPSGVTGKFGLTRQYTSRQLGVELFVVELVVVVVAGMSGMG